MTISHSPAPARSDVAKTAPTGSSPRHPYAVHGRVLTAGALAWSASMALYGLNPESDLGLAVQGVGALLFQVGLLFLLRTLWRTRALGEGKVARGVLRFEAFLVSMAMASTFVDAIRVSDLDQVGWAILDAFWPFSMLGMFFIGIRIAIAGRWKGTSRFWPMVAESWAVVTIPALGIFGETVGNAVACLHLVVGYAVLGVLVSRKTD
ncbi:hypothetical protein L2K70_10545 [Nocardioides KLBMP 9356]|uniref:Uncharacterized protein n=1 Tax=Nocardioides potassii TaxID=2911371 RepID=A0ABS9H9Z6_9ACTN|nr:hypothetical protein [Nocardioides potassii]MCF6378045.1 hypothetical protein [Nocardioides potassii]